MSQALLTSTFLIILSATVECGNYINRNKFYYLNSRVHNFFVNGIDDADGLIPTDASTPPPTPPPTTPAPAYCSNVSLCFDEAFAGCFDAMQRDNATASQLATCQGTVKDHEEKLKDHWYAILQIKVQMCHKKNPKKRQLRELNAWNEMRVAEIERQAKQTSARDIQESGAKRAVDQVHIDCLAQGLRDCEDCLYKIRKCPRILRWQPPCENEIHDDTAKTLRATKRYIRPLSKCLEK